MDVICLATKPFSLAGIVLNAGVRSVTVATLAWWHLVSGIVNFHIGLCWKALILSITCVSLPARIFTAFQRERTLEMQLHELQTRWENVIWENKELEQRFQRAIKERKVIETLFEEIEEEHEKALSRIDQLEDELKDLEEESLRLTEIRGKAPWDYKARDEKIGSVPEGTPLGHDHVVPSWRTGYKSGGTILKEILMQGETLGDAEKNKLHEESPITSYSYPSQKMSRDSSADKTFEQRRTVALSHSLFSSILSLVVGMIIWKAEDPCMPLVAALFTVVGMSLYSVVQFFSTIRNKPASDAVALLSINWFILGTLTSPALPGVARVLAPRMSRLAERLLIWLGFSL